MFQRVFVLVLAIVVCLAVGPAWGEEADISGDYNFILSDSDSSGPCPMGGDGSGSLTISKTASGYALGYIKGMVCRPAEVCALTGTCDGNRCVFTTTVTVDNEGGTVTNKADLTFEQNHAVGSGGTVYKHPSGMQCSWSYLLTLTK